MTITLTHQVQSLREKLMKYVQACVKKQQVDAEAAQYFLEELRALPTMPRYTLTGLSQVGKTTIIDVLLGKVAANCVEGTYFIHENVHMLYPPNTFLHDLDFLEEVILHISQPDAVDEQSDTILWVTQYGNIGSEQEVKQLEAYAAAGKRIIGLVNMIDIHDQLVDEPLQLHVDEQLKPIAPFLARVFPISASYAEAAQEFYDDDLYDRSGFLQLEAFLEDHEAFYAEQLKQCWELFTPFIEYIESLMKTAYKEIAPLIAKFELTIQQVVDAHDEELVRIVNAPLQQYVPEFEGEIASYMQHDVFFQSSMRDTVLQAETLFLTPATMQELEDLMVVLLHDEEEELPSYHVYYKMQQLYASFAEQVAELARTNKLEALRAWQQAQTFTFMQHDDITAYREAYEFHITFIDKISKLFEQPLPITLRDVELTLEENVPAVVMDSHYALPFTFEALISEYLVEHITSFFDETEQHLEATESVIREMTQIVNSAICDAEMMAQFQERLEQIETINELLLLFDGKFDEQETMDQRFELFHELIENYRMLEAKMDVYDEQAQQTLTQHEETYAAIISAYRHYALLTNRDKQELRAIVQDYDGIQAFRQQQYEELDRAYRELDEQATEHKQILIHQYDQYMKRYKEQMDQREYVMSEWRTALEERQEMLVKRDRLRILQNSKLVVEHVEQPALRALEQRIELLLLRIEQLYDYDLPALPTYDAALYNITPIKEATLPVEYEVKQFTQIETIPVKYDKMPYRGLIISGCSVATAAVLFGLIYGVLFLLGMVETPLHEVLFNSL